MTENWRRLGGGAVHFGKSNSLLSKTQPRKTTISRNSFPVSDLSSGGSDHDGQLARIRRRVRPFKWRLRSRRPTRQNTPPQAHSAAQFARSPPARPRTSPSRPHPHNAPQRRPPAIALPDRRRLPNHLLRCCLPHSGFLDDRLFLCRQPFRSRNLFRSPLFLQVRYYTPGQRPSVVVHPNNHVLPYPLTAFLVPANALVNRNIREADNLKPIAILFSKVSILPFVNWVEVGIVDNDIQPRFHCLRDQFRLPFDDLPLTSRTFRNKPHPNLILVYTDGPAFAVLVHHGQFLLSPCSLSGSRKTPQKV